MQGYSGVCWITRDEDDELNRRGYKSKRPGGSLDCYARCGIKVLPRPVSEPSDHLRACEDGEAEVLVDAARRGWPRRARTQLAKSRYVRLTPWRDRLAGNNQVTIACRARRCESAAKVFAAGSSLNPLYMKLSRLIPLCLFPLIACLASCKEKGPAEKVGEKVDDALGK
jgi:hypothetical protein